MGRMWTSPLNFWFCWLAHRFFLEFVWPVSTEWAAGAVTSGRSPGGCDACHLLHGAGRWWSQTGHLPSSLGSQPANPEENFVQYGAVHHPCEWKACVMNKRQKHTSLAFLLDLWRNIYRSLLLLMSKKWSPSPNMLLYSSLSNSNINILYNHGTLIKTKKLTLVQCY